MVSAERIRATKAPDVVMINSCEEIPAFASEDTEREWWATHQLTQELHTQLQDVSPELDKILPSVPDKPNHAAG